jgi:sugar lactone lactonase YvrE
MSVPEHGGTPQAIATNQDYPWAIAVDDNNVYWTTYDGSAAQPNGAASASGALWKAPLTGGAPVMLDSALSGPWGIAVDGTNIYFSTYTGNRIKSVPIASTGAGPETVVAVIPAGPGGAPLGIAVDDTNVYYTSAGGGVYSIAKTAVMGTPTEVVSPNAVTGGYNVVVSGATLYFSDDGQSGNVYSVPSAGGRPPTVIASGQQVASFVAVDANNVYWTNYQASGAACPSNTSACGSLNSVPLAGGAVTTLAYQVNYPQGLAVDQNGVYFAASSGGRVWSISPP